MDILPLRLQQIAENKGITWYDDILKNERHVKATVGVLLTEEEKNYISLTFAIWMIPLTIVFD